MPQKYYEDLLKVPIHTVCLQFYQKMNPRVVSIALFKVLQNAEKKIGATFPIEVITYGVSEPMGYITYKLQVFEKVFLFKKLVFNVSNLIYSPGLENRLLGDC